MFAIYTTRVLDTDNCVSLTVTKKVAFCFACVRWDLWLLRVNKKKQVRMAYLFHTVASETLIIVNMIIKNFKRWFQRKPLKTHHYMPGSCRIMLFQWDERFLTLTSQNEEPPFSCFSPYLVPHHPSSCQQTRLRQKKCHLMRPETNPYFCRRFKVMRFL